MIDTELRDKVVLVTGANNPFGIGAAITEAFAAQGTSVFITYLRSRPEEFGIDAATAAEVTTPGRGVLPGAKCRGARCGAWPPP